MIKLDHLRSRCRPHLDERNEVKVESISASGASATAAVEADILDWPLPIA
jgi:hypothetical protein